MHLINRAILSASLFLTATQMARAQNAEDMAKQLSNPVSSLISVPYQLNYDRGIGPNGDGHRTTMNFQPVVPISIGENWNLISRTIIPFTKQTDVIPGTSQSGVGDIVQSFFFSPKSPTAGGLIWGVGPVFLLPTAQDGLGADQFAAGLTGVVLKQNGPWTIGALANHLWDVGGGSGATDISSTFFQPFISYTTPTAWTFGVNSEATHDWENDQYSIPINFTVSKVANLFGNPVSFTGGVRYWADSPPNGPEDWGARFVITFLYPK